ncbi:SurA N-terminal domain-containing protein [Thiohalobacter sp. IOR34]|uniref:SurA N-terminal domain-containing protein n=1 Tax=Thiohalobacter sp. IOR34 TaxID=3057176 RepID=UPI0025B20D54|nr:SurA N-terminal domain-containing protein [Thiohalobacter sp. IOR34]WJW74494.1 SurA N-terminal domain-containing protein [Thiohalobacter sp. IOR34]
MLQAIRDRITGVVAWLIVGLISVVFALWGIDWYLKSDAKIYAAKVNDVEISVKDYRLGYQQQLNRMRSLLKERFDRRMFSTPEFKKAVLERLVEEELIVQAAEAAGMAISDGLLAARVQAMPEFQEDGQFSADRYRQLLARQNLSPAMFEHSLRRSMLINQFISSIGTSGLATRRDVEQGLRLQGQQRSLKYLRIPMADQRKAIQVGEADIEAFYQANKARFVEPEKVRLEYIELKLDDLAAARQPDEAELRELYQAEVAKFSADEQRRARHILIQVAKDAPEEVVQAARSKAEKLVSQLREGADFAELAKANSDDPGSAAQGGDLGFFGKGAMVPEFEAAVFAQEKGQISDPVRSDFGFHIIEVTDIRKPEPPSFDSLREQLIRDATRGELEDLFYEQLDTLANASFETPDSLQPAAEATGLPLKETGWISRQGGEGIAADPRVVEAAFNEDVLEQGNNSKVIELGPNHAVVLRVAERKPPRQLPLEAVREQIEAQLRTQKAVEAARKLGEAIQAAVEGGETLQAAAEQHGLKVEDAGFVSRTDSKLDRQIVMAAFRAPRRADGRPALAGVALANGDYAVLEIDEVRDADTSQIPEEERRAFRDSLAQLHGSMESKQLIEQLKDGAEIELNLQAIQ